MALTKVRLLENVDINSTYKDSYTFTSKSAQEAFFLSKTPDNTSKYVRNDLNYQKKEMSLKWSGNVEDFYNISYMMFRNDDYSDSLKWFYAFITEIKYSSKNTVEIVFEVDEIQTWFFESDLEYCMVERMHTVTDTLGEHLVDEGIDTEEMLNLAKVDVSSIKPLAIVGCSAYRTGEGLQAFPNVVNGNLMMVQYKGWEFSEITYDGVNDLTTWLANHYSANKQAEIVAVFSMPRALINYPTLGGAFLDDLTPVVLDYSITKNLSNLDGYSPRNNKLFTHPYNFLQATNNNGSIMDYKYEFFDSLTLCEFEITGDISPQPTVGMYPKIYKNAVENEMNMLTLTNYPQATWTGSYYSAWLASNPVAPYTGVAGSAIGMAVSIGTGNPFGVVSSALSVANSLGSFSRAKAQPNPVKRGSQGTFNTALGIQTFTFYKKCLRAERARIIDDYFTRYGYKVMRNIKPNLQTRQNWNYWKMLDVTLTGNIPNKSKEIFIKAFLNGVTFWHSDNIGNYNLSNNPI